MIKAKHNKFYIKFSSNYAKLLLSIYFRNIRYVGDYEQSNLPVLIISNHFSWWDGFIQIQLNNKYFKRRLHLMMLENELRKTMHLTGLGAFSIEKRRHSMIESLKYSLEILQNPENLLLFFPQGKIQSIYTSKFVFEKGLLNYIIKKLKNEFQFVFNVNLIDYSSKRRPEISVYFKTYDWGKNPTVDDIERDFNLYANNCIAKQREE
jgi:hypothetical protein